MTKPIAVFLTLAVLLATPYSVYAGPEQANGTEIITLEECMDRAVKYNHQGAVLDQQIDELWKQHNELFEMSHALQKQLDTLERYEELYEKSKKGPSLTIEEQGELMVYQSIFGEKPPIYSSTEMFEQFIRNRDFPHYSIWASIQNLITSRKMIDTTVKMGAKQIFDGLIDMQDAILLQEQLFQNMKKQNEQMLVAYKKGMVSEIDKYTSDCSLEKQRLSIQKMKRSIENMEMTLKQQIGMPLNEKLVISYNGSKGIKLANSCSTYLTKALESRNEVINAKMNLHVAQRENDIIRQYITDELISERMESDMALVERQIAYDEAINSVTVDITNGYRDAQLKLQNFYISIEQLQNAEKQYKEAVVKYDKGLISLSSLWNTEISYTQAKIGYNKSMRDYNNAVYKLNIASGIGPGYATGGY